MSYNRQFQRSAFNLFAIFHTDLSVFFRSSEYCCLFYGANSSHYPRITVERKLLSYIIIIIVAPPSTACTRDRGVDKRLQCSQTQTVLISFRVTEEIGKRQDRPNRGAAACSLFLFLFVRTFRN